MTLFLFSEGATGTYKGGQSHHSLHGPSQLTAQSPMTRMLASRFNTGEGGITLIADRGKAAEDTSSTSNRRKEGRIGILAKKLGSDMSTSSPSPAYAHNQEHITVLSVEVHANSLHHTSSSSSSAHVSTSTVAASTSSSSSSSSSRFSTLFANQANPRGSAAVAPPSALSSSEGVVASSPPSLPIFRRLRPNPKRDPLQAIFYSIEHQLHGKAKSENEIYNGVLLSTQTLNLLALSTTNREKGSKGGNAMSGNKARLLLGLPNDITVSVFNNEHELIHAFIRLVRGIDVDIIVSFHPSKLIFVNYLAFIYSRHPVRVHLHLNIPSACCIFLPGWT